MAATETVTAGLDDDATGLSHTAIALAAVFGLIFVGVGILFGALLRRYWAGRVHLPRTMPRRHKRRPTPLHLAASSDPRPTIDPEPSSSLSVPDPAHLPRPSPYMLLSPMSSYTPQSSPMPLLAFSPDDARATSQSFDSPPPYHEAAPSRVASYISR